MSPLLSTPISSSQTLTTSRHLPESEITAQLNLIQNSTGDSTPPSVIYLGRTDVEIGRSKTCQHVLSFEDMSRRHCKLEFGQDGKWSIRDLSTNGVFVTPTKQPPKTLRPGQVTPLHDKDMIQLLPNLSYQFVTISNKKTKVTLTRGSVPTETLSPQEGQRQGQGRSSSNDKTTNDTDRIMKYLHQRHGEGMKLDEFIEKMLKVVKEDEAKVKDDVKVKDDTKVNDKAVVNDPSTQEPEVAKKFANLLESQLSCCVCSDVFVEPVTSPCGHTYCSDCITKWLLQKSACPTCRSPIFSSNPPVKNVEMSNYLEEVYKMLGEDYKKRRESLVRGRRDESKVNKGQQLGSLTQQLQQQTIGYHQHEVYTMRDFFWFLQEQQNNAGTISN